MNVKDSGNMISIYQFSVQITLHWQKFPGFTLWPFQVYLKPQTIKVLVFMCSAFTWFF